MKRLDAEGRETDLLRQTAMRYEDARDALPDFFGVRYFHAHPDDVKTFDAMPFSLEMVQKALRRAASAADRGGAGELLPDELREFGRAEPPVSDERLERAMTLSESAAFRLRKRLRRDTPALVAAFADLHVFAEFLHRRLLGV